MLELPRLSPSLAYCPNCSRNFSSQHDHCGPRRKHRNRPVFFGERTQLESLLSREEYPKFSVHLCQKVLADIFIEVTKTSGHIYLLTISTIFPRACSGSWWILEETRNRTLYVWALLLRPGLIMGHQRQISLLGFTTHAKFFGSVTVTTKILKRPDRLGIGLGP